MDVMIISYNLEGMVEINNNIKLHQVSYFRQSYNKPFVVLSLGISYMDQLFQDDSIQKRKERKSNGIYTSLMEQLGKNKDSLKSHSSDIANEVFSWRYNESRR